METNFFAKCRRKIISKALSKRLKNVLASLISDNQSTYVDERFISQGGRLTVDVLQITDVLKLSSMLVIVDIQKFFSLKEIWIRQNVH